MRYFKKFLLVLNFGSCKTKFFLVPKFGVLQFGLVPASSGQTGDLLDHPRLSDVLSDVTEHPHGESRAQPRHSNVKVSVVPALSTPPFSFASTYPGPSPHALDPACAQVRQEDNVEQKVDRFGDLPVPAKQAVPDIIHTTSRTPSTSAVAPHPHHNTRSLPFQFK